MFWPRVAHFLLWLGRWEVIGRPPDLLKAVIIGAPHTSYWDGYWALVYKVAVGLDVKFYVKKSLFWFPLNVLLKGLGAVPLDRSKAGRAVEHTIEVLNRNDRYFFGLAPEGTRRKMPGWKSGFYRIAEGAAVPVVLGFFDYRNKRLGLGPTITLTGDADADLRIIRSFYESTSGRRPELATPAVFVKNHRKAAAKSDA
ncbi:MAG: 1-acyl-sn-glycerol-3-phosphate acyltransferase [Gammaproteobacteria bacterium]|nr:1-acyl-sn-glycerol-3-phosphate acyltransferase [Gammaproteobacteria bacterium]